MYKFISTISIFLAGISPFSAQTWSALSTGTTANLIGIHFVNANVGWAVGSGGKIISTINGGSTWTTQSSGTSSTFYAVYALSTNIAIAVGDTSTIRRTTDGGATWTTIPSPVAANWRNIFFLDASNGFIVGGPAPGSPRMAKTTDGGATWTAITIPGSIALYGVAFTSPDTGYAGDAAGIIKKTADGGASWTSTSTGMSGFLDAFWFTDPNTGYTSGSNGTIMKTTNAGASWTSLPSGTTVDRLLDCEFVTPAVGYTLGGPVPATTTGRIYKTYDGGASWTLDASTGARLYRCTFPNAFVGYACGLYGTVLKVKNVELVGLEEQENRLNMKAFPSPFVSGFIATINLATEAEVLATLFDVSGTEVLSKSFGKMAQGAQDLEFDNLKMSPGAYFLRISAGNLSQSCKLIRTE